MTVRAVALVALLALGGCTPAPRPPLYSALQETGRFGHFEEQLGADRYRVGYSAPIARASALSRAERQREAERLVSLAYDMALMRASELALANGYASFDVSERENNVEADVHHEYGYDPLFAPWPHWHYRYRYFPYPYPAPVYGYRERFTEVAAGVTFVATLHRQAGAGALDARSTLERLEAKYPGARTMATGTNAT